MEKDRRDDDRKGQGDQDRSVTIAEPVEPQREQAGNGHRDDTARRDPRDQQPLVPGDGRESETEQDRGWPHQKQKRQQEADEAPFELAQHL